MPDDRRLIEDYLPIEAISAEASREKSVRKGHISTLHLWWARRPLVACRAAVYGALVPLHRFRPKNGPEEKRDSLTRANAAKFVRDLCKYPGSKKVIEQAEQHILEAHADRLTVERGENVTVEDIVEGRAPRPKVLDMFAGGGAIPLEALRLGCDAYALDLNPVAHVIELCTLVYPQKYGKPDPTARGMTGPQSEQGEATWGGLTKEVRYWGERVLEVVKSEIGDLYPPIPAGRLKTGAPAVTSQGKMEFGIGQGLKFDLDLLPAMYLWTRSVQCKNPTCKALVPMLRQTWLCKSQGRYAVLAQSTGDGESGRVAFEVLESSNLVDIGITLREISRGGSAVCAFCGTAADEKYVRSQGLARQLEKQLLAIVALEPKTRKKLYLGEAQLPVGVVPDQAELLRRLDDLCQASHLTLPDEPIDSSRPSPNARGLSAVTRHGFTAFRDLFDLRQLVAMMSFVGAVRQVIDKVPDDSSSERKIAVGACLACIVDRLADFNSSFCVHNYFGSSRIAHTFGRHALPMVWDYAEANPLAENSGGWGTEAIVAAIDGAVEVGTRPANVQRGSATSTNLADESIDAIVTDPPYYDNVPYADISDFFYVWLKRVLGELLPEHFAGMLTPKSSEVTALSSRHSGNFDAAREHYESMMAKTLQEARRILKPEGRLIMVYAHKTTLGWSTLVNAMRQAGFIVVEAWPLDTEKPGRLIAQDTASLASSIFLIAQKRKEDLVGSFDDVRPHLEEIVAERVSTLWEQGVGGGDLVIACVGAGLRAFTRYVKVEYANGEEVPAERFLSEVETTVLEHILTKLSEQAGGKGAQHDLAAVDPWTRFYLLWRYTYGSAEQDSGEAIVFANGTNVELDGPNGLSSDPRPLLAKKSGKYRLIDFIERGEDARLGLPDADGISAPTVDVLHRTLWLMENRPAAIPGFLREAQPNLEQMRLVAQALGGPALKGGEWTKLASSNETAALAKLTANWRSVIEGGAFQRDREDARLGQTAFDLG